MPESANHPKYANQNVFNKIFFGGFNRKLVDIAKFAKPTKILDIGCGEGFNLVNLARNKVGKAYEGIDNSSDAIKKGKRNYPTLSIEHGETDHLSQKDNSFDLVICTEVLEHLKNPEKALAEVSRVTKKYAIFAVPNEPFFSIFKFLHGGHLKSHSNRAKHINKWTLPGFKKFLRKNGFKISKTTTSFPWVVILARK